MATAPKKTTTKPPAKPAVKKLPSRNVTKEKAAIKTKGQKPTVALQDVYRGFPVFQIWEADEKGKAIGEKPLFSMGISKVGLIGKHIDDMRAFYHEHKDSLKKPGAQDKE